MIYVRNNKEETEQAIAEFKEGGNVEIQIRVHKKSAPSSTMTLGANDIDIDGGVKLSTILNPDDEIKFGRCISTEIIVYFIKNDKTIDIDWSQEILVSMYSQTTLYSFYLGRFYGDSPQKAYNNGVELLVYTGYDNAAKYNNMIADDFLATVTFPITSRDFNVQLQDYYNTNYGIYIGINALFTNSYIESNPFPTGTTLGTIVGCIVETEFTNAVCFGSSGKNLSHCPYKKPSYSVEYKITPDDYFELNKSDINTKPIPALQYVDTSDPSNNYTYPTTYTGVPYKIVNNPILAHMSSSTRESVVRMIYSNIGSFYPDNPVLFSYTPMNVVAVGNPVVEAGDVIEIEDMEGNTLDLYVTSLIREWHGFLRDYYECAGTSERQETNEVTQEQYYLDGRYVNKDKIGSASYCDVYNALDETSSGKVLDARQGKELDDAKLNRAGDTMTGNLTMDNGTNISYAGTDATYPVIKFVNGDAYGQGVVICGGGLTIIGSGESADNIASGKSGSSETMYVGSDGAVYIMTNCNNGVNSAKSFIFGTSGILDIPGSVKKTITSGISYIAAFLDGNTIAQLNKSEGAVWYPVVTTRTAGGGGWAIGNYSNENLQFVYGSKANINSQTNNCNIINLPVGDGTIALTKNAISNITRSGTTFTATRADGTTFTFTQQDSNTWRGFTTKAYTYRYTVNANAALNITGTNFAMSTPSGYTPVAITYFSTGAGNGSVVSHLVNATSTAGATVMSVRNITSSSQTFTATICVLYLQN